MIISRAQLLGMKARRYKDVAIPDGIVLGDGSVTKDAKIRIQSLTAGELDAYQASTYVVAKGRDKVLIDASSLEEHGRRLLRLVIVDENNSRMLFADDDLPFLDIDGMVTSLLYREACQHCGIRELDEQIEKKDSKRTNAGSDGTAVVA